MNADYHLCLCSPCCYRPPDRPSRPDALYTTGSNSISLIVSSRQLTFYPMKPTSNFSPPQDPIAELEQPSKGSFFWLSFIAVVTSIFLSALDLTAVATALPTITSDLNGGDDFSWVGSAYALSSTAFLPLSGALADVFGRKPVMMGSILLFAIGSALAGAAQTMTMLIIARSTLRKPIVHCRYLMTCLLAVQGLGGGGIINLAEIITSDLVPLAERGLYQGLIALTWSFASGIGPPIVRRNNASTSCRYNLTAS